MGDYVPLVRPSRYNVRFTPECDEAWWIRSVIIESLEPATFVQDLVNVLHDEIPLTEDSTPQLENMSFKTDYNLDSRDYTFSLECIVQKKDFVGDPNLLRLRSQHYPVDGSYLGENR